MKKDTHPDNYREVAFIDINHPEKHILCKSTIKTDKKILIGETQYPSVSIDVSYLSHPFYTKKTNYIPQAGPVDRFNKKYSKFFNSKVDSPKEEEKNS